MLNGKGLEATVELVRQAREGRSAAVEELLSRYRPRLLRWASGRIPARRRALLDTEDLVQDTLLRTCAQLHRLKEPGAFPFYVRRALRNRLRDELRRRPPVEPLDKADEIPDPAPSPAEEAIGRERLERYESALETLSEKERLAVVGRLEWGLPYAELATELGAASPDAARMTVTRALVKLSRRIAGDD
jgi:RNA polymerase sigma-70 factor (ECF subfamily)